jgi:hypothetical protein
MRTTPFLLLAFFLLAACSGDTSRELCAEGEIECAGVCVDPQTSLEHCGQ